MGVSIWGTVFKGPSIRGVENPSSTASIFQYLLKGGVSVSLYLRNLTFTVFIIVVDAGISHGEERGIRLRGQCAGLGSILWFSSMFVPPCINKFFFKRLGFGSAEVLQKISLPCVAMDDLLLLSASSIKEGLQSGLSSHGPPWIMLWLETWQQGEANECVFKCISALALRVCVNFGN